MNNITKHSQPHTVSKESDEQATIHVIYRWRIKYCFSVCFNHQFQTYTVDRTRQQSVDIFGNLNIYASNL